ncbi:Uncharacterized protein Rs2_36747 [Raphanus sativus]|nr:Uncharacterized protein Rs2_36747 [Raphanus sativus]
MDNYNEDIKTRKTRFKQRKSKLTSWVLREVSSLESFTGNSKVYNTADSKVFTHSLLAKWFTFYILEESLESARPNILQRILNTRTKPHKKIERRKPNVPKSSNKFSFICSTKKDNQSRLEGS